MHQPIKRHLLLQDLSRDHHQGLLLSWKIRTGFKKEIEPKRMMNYVKWFWLTHLEDHFKIEEETVFTVLGFENEMVKRALVDHREIESIIDGTERDEVRLNALEGLLVKHIRFEERVLFNEIQNVATDLELRKIKLAHSEEKFVDNLDDPFWL